MLLGYFGRAMAKQGGNALDRRAGFEQLDSEGVPKAVRVSSMHFGRCEEIGECFRPLLPGGLDRPQPSPKKVFRADAGQGSKFLDREWRQRDVYVLAGLGGKEPELSILDAVDGAAYGVGDPQPRVS